MQIAVINKSSKLDDADIAFACKAVDAQVMECAAAWGVTPTPVVWYGRNDTLPQKNCRVLVLVDELDVPDAGGYHTDEGGVIYARVLVRGSLADVTTTISHEALEELIDSTCDQWRAMPDGRSVALEVADPVEADSYGVEVVIDGESRTIELSNYVLPRWFDPAASYETGPFDRMQIVRQPFGLTDGGYMVVRDRIGNETNVFARQDDEAARASIEQKKANAETRLARRLAA